METETAAIYLGIITLAYVLPILIILFSSKTTFGEKIAWILGVLFISWGAFIFYLLLAPISKRKDHDRHHRDF